MVNISNFDQTKINKMENQAINRLTLKALLLAEITRFKYHLKSSGLAPAAIESGARGRYAKQMDIPANSKPDVFILAMGMTYNDNELLEDYKQTLQKFGIADAFIPTVEALIEEEKVKGVKP